MTYLEPVYETEQQRPLHPGLESCILRKRKSGGGVEAFREDHIECKFDVGRAKHHHLPCATITSSTSGFDGTSDDSGVSLVPVWRLQKSLPLILQPYLYI